MTSDTQVILAALRSQAWKRAVGELESMLVTFYGEKEKFEKLGLAITNFVTEVENNGLDE